MLFSRFIFLFIIFAIFVIFFFFFFFNDTATTEIYTLSLHDALPISIGRLRSLPKQEARSVQRWEAGTRSEEHTSELQSRQYLVCRLLLEKKKTNTITNLETTASTNEHTVSQYDICRTADTYPSNDVH